MSPVPQGWETAHTDVKIGECIPVFLETDPLHYAKMDLAYCKNKIATGCMWLWRIDGINWNSKPTVRRDGVAVSFLLWRPRDASNQPIERRFCLCLFLGNQRTDPNVVLNQLKLKAAITEFADDQHPPARGRFYIVKQDQHVYPPRVDAVMNAAFPRLQKQPDAPAGHGWPARNVWKIINWT